MPAAPVIGAVAAGVGAATAVVGTINAQKNAKKQAKAQQRAARYERQRNSLQSALQRREAVRAARSAYAEAQVAAENQGVDGSSGAAGGQASIVSQTNFNLSFLDQYNYLSDQASIQLGKAAKAGAQASMWSSLASIGSTVYQQSGGIKFKGPTPPKGN